MSEGYARLPILRGTRFLPPPAAVCLYARVRAFFMPAIDGTVPRAELIREGESERVGLGMVLVAAWSLRVVRLVMMDR